MSWEEEHLNLIALVLVPQGSLSCGGSHVWSCHCLHPGWSRDGSGDYHFLLNKAGLNREAWVFHSCPRAQSSQGSVIQERLSSKLWNDQRQRLTDGTREHSSLWTNLPCLWFTGESFLTPQFLWCWRYLNLPSSSPRECQSSLSLVPILPLACYTSCDHPPLSEEPIVGHGGRTAARMSCKLARMSLDI